MSHGKMSDPEFREALLGLVAEGHTLTKACEKMGVHRTNVTRYCWKHQDFAQQLDRARIEMAHTLAEECIDIADTDEDPQRARNRIESRKWFVATVVPKVYSPRANLDVTVEDRSNLGALRAEAWARVANAAAAGLIPKPDIEDAEVIPPPALPAPDEPTPDPFA